MSEPKTSSETVNDERKYTPVFSQFQPGIVIGYERVEERVEEREEDE